MAHKLDMIQSSRCLKVIGTWWGFISRHWHQLHEELARKAREAADASSAGGAVAGMRVRFGRICTPFACLRTCTDFARRQLPPNDKAEMNITAQKNAMLLVVALFVLGVTALTVTSVGLHECDKLKRTRPSYLGGLVDEVLVYKRALNATEVRWLYNGFQSHGQLANWNGDQRSWLPTPAPSPEPTFPPTSEPTPLPTTAPIPEPTFEPTLFAGEEKCKKLNGENQFDFRTLLAEVDDNTIWGDKAIRCAVAMESSHYPFFEKTILTFACVDTTTEAWDNERFFCDKFVTGGFSLGLGLMYDVAHGKKNAVGDYTNGYAYFQDRHSVRIADVYGCSPQLSLCLGPCPLEWISTCNFYVDGETVGGVYKPFAWGIGLNLRVFHTGTVWRRRSVPMCGCVSRISVWSGHYIDAVQFEYDLERCPGVIDYVLSSANSLLFLTYGNNWIKWGPETGALSLVINVGAQDLASVTWGASSAHLGCSVSVGLGDGSIYTAGGAFCSILSSRTWTASTDNSILALDEVTSGMGPSGVVQVAKCPLSPTLLPTPTPTVSSWPTISFAPMSVPTISLHCKLYDRCSHRCPC